MELKRYGKEFRAMDKEIKGWDVFVQMEALIKNLLTSLRAVTELQNPAIRDRHWIQLMQATKVIFNFFKYHFFDYITLCLILLLYAAKKAEERFPCGFVVSNEKKNAFVVSDEIKI